MRTFAGLQTLTKITKRFFSFTATPMDSRRNSRKSVVVSEREAKGSEGQAAEDWDQFHISSWPCRSLPCRSRILRGRFTRRCPTFRSKESSLGTACTTPRLDIPRHPDRLHIPQTLIAPRRSISLYMLNLVTFWCTPVAFNNYRD